MLKETAEFEKDVWNLVSSIQFSNERTQFQKTLKKQLNDITKSSHVYIKADKTNNMYKTTPEYYSKLLSNSVTKEYKKVDDSTVNRINVEAKEIAKKLELDDRIECLTQKQAFITIKDHKQNFINKPECRLINPTKTEIGIISQKILKKITTFVRKKTGLKQWINTNDAIAWFNSLENKQNLEFLQCDINSYYPSITKKNPTESHFLCGRILHNSGRRKKHHFSLQKHRHVHKRFSMDKESI